MATEQQASAGGQDEYAALAKHQRARAVTLPASGTASQPLAPAEFTGSALRESEPPCPPAGAWPLPLGGAADGRPPQRDGLEIIGQDRPRPSIHAQARAAARRGSRPGAEAVTPGTIPAGRLDQDLEGSR